ncbi:YiiX family permuted papain-like enzyme [Ancylomarina sp. YFZ004]
MKKYFIIGLIFTVLIILGLMYSGLRLMAEEDRHIDIEYLAPTLQDGDIIFQISKSTQSRAIQLATKSKYSHVGMIYKKSDQVFVFEAVQPVKLTLLEDWISRGERKHFVIKRLKDSEKILTDEVKIKMKHIGDRFLGKDYDIYFEWSDNRIYCSELVWKIYKEAVNLEIGQLENLSKFDLSNKLVKQKLKERYGDNIPMDEIVISPASIFDSEQLKLVYEE